MGHDTYHGQGKSDMIVVEILKERDHLEYLGIDERITLK
jgi:hypothetical protein